MQNLGEGRGGGGLTRRVMLYVKMVNESAQGTTSSMQRALALFQITAIILLIKNIQCGVP